MKDLDQRFRQASGLSERRFYSIFYSQVFPAPLLLLGFNPGGNPGTWEESLLASRSFYENGEHEYVDFRHDSKFYRAMQSFLMQVLHLSNANDIRGIPKTNLIFRRSSQSDSGIFRRQQSISLSEALAEAQPFVEEIIQRVQPQAILLEGKQTLELFVKNYCTSWESTVDGEPVTTPNGKYRAVLYQARQGFVQVLQRNLPLVSIGHPSKYAARHEWREVISRTEAALYPTWVNGRGEA